MKWVTSCGVRPWLLPEVFLKGRLRGAHLATRWPFHYRGFRFSATLPPAGERGGTAHAGSGGAGYAITGHHELMIRCWRPR